MEIALTPEIAALVERHITSGRFGSVEQVLSEGLRLLDDEEQRRVRELADFQQAIQRRLDSLDRGEGIPGEEVEANFRDKAAMRRQQAA